MQIRAEQLAATLKRSGLAPIYCLSGDEPLQMLECADRIREFARGQGIDERTVLNVDKDFDWNRLREAGANLSLFSNRRLLELRLEGQKPGREGGAALTDYAAKPEPDNILLITCNRLDKQAQNTKWYKSLAQAGVMVPVWPITPTRMPEWLMERVRLLGKTIERDAAALIAQRVEGNLLAARQELEKLALLVDKPVIELEDVMSAVADSARFEVFALIETLCLGNLERTRRMLQGLRNEGVEPLGIFGALMWEFRRICSMAHAMQAGMPKQRVFAEYKVWEQRQPATDKMLSRFNCREFGELLHHAALVDRSLKGALSANPWDTLENFMFRIAGVRLQSQPL